MVMSIKKHVYYVNSGIEDTYYIAYLNKIQPVWVNLVWE